MPPGARRKREAETRVLSSAMRPMHFSVSGALQCDGAAHLPQESRKGWASAVQRSARRSGTGCISAAGMVIVRTVPETRSLAVQSVAAFKLRSASNTAGAGPVAALAALLG